MKNCDGKQNFTRKQAEAVLKKIKLSDKSSAKNAARRMYRCPDCDYWHLTCQATRRSNVESTKRRAKSKAACKDIPGFLDADGDWVGDVE